MGRRLHLSRPDFTRVSGDRAAKRVSSEHFSVTVSRAAAGCAAVVSKKVAKTAVGRHLLKRRAREAVYAVPGASDHAIIVYAKPGAATLPYATIATEIANLLQAVVS